MVVSEEQEETQKRERNMFKIYNFSRTQDRVQENVKEVSDTRYLQEHTKNRSIVSRVLQSVITMDIK